MSGRVLRAGLLAAALSGAPSTLHALARGRSPLEAALAAGALVAGGRRPAAVRLAAAVPVHLAISLGWAAVLDRVLPPRRRAAWGALAGLGIAALDLGVVGRRVPAIRALPQGPQVADHVAFGAIAGAALGPPPTSGPSAARRPGGSPRR
ncbi:MAG: hypothetical protein IRZ32_04845 [Solirubrobacteraceae bacterium]|nr:hypothetical protein [Solirubrobacteraceae bacterium]